MRGYFTIEDLSSSACPSIPPMLCVLSSEAIITIIIGNQLSWGLQALSTEAWMCPPPPNTTVCFLQVHGRDLPLAAGQELAVRDAHDHLAGLRCALAAVGGARMASLEVGQGAQHLVLGM